MTTRWEPGGSGVPVRGGAGTVVPAKPGWQAARVSSAPKTVDTPASFAASAKRTTP